MPSSLIALVALLGCSGDGPEPPVTPPPAPTASAESATVDCGERPDIVMVTLDTTRADRLGAWGHDNAHTENVDALAARGRRYSRAYSPLPLTIPSHASLFTGTYPPEHGIRSNGGGTLHEDASTLAEHLDRCGYATGASVAAFVTTRTWGFEQGFDAFYDDVPIGDDFWHASRAGAEVVDDIIAWRDAQTGDDPLFAWVHLYDPHFPFQPPPQYLDEAGGKPYDGELAYVDDQVGRVMERFSAPDTLFVIVGDHGEGLSEHSELTHGLFAYNSTQHVPFILAGPGVEPAVIDEPVSLVDVTPTLLAAAGLPPLPGATSGRVVPGSPPEPVYMESWQLAERFGVSPHIALVDGRFKLVDLPRPELYDLVADPGELNDVAADHPEVVTRMKAALDGLGFGPPTSSPTHPAPPEVAMQLEALGYMEGGFKGDLAGPLPDLKDRMDLIERALKSDRHSLKQETEENEKLLRELIADYPDIVEFQSRLAGVLMRTGRAEEALRVVEGALQLDPENQMLRFARASHLARAQRFEEASILFQEAAAAMPYSPRVRTSAVAALLDAPGGGNKGVELGFEYLEEYPEDYNLAGLLGVAMVQRGFMEKGVELLEMGRLATKPERDVLYYCAQIATGRRQRDEAIRLLEKELEYYPGNLRAVSALAQFMVPKKDWEGQLRIAERGLVLHPADPMLWHLRSQALFNLTRYEEARESLEKGLSYAPESPMLLLLDANLLNQEGKRAEAEARFEQAKAAKEKADEEMRTMMEGGGPGLPAPPPSSP